MFYYLDGTVALADAHTAVIDCGGVGYKCSVSLHTQAQLTVGKRTKLYTYLNVGEGVFELYGFADLEERSVFTMLIGVSGVGMKVALSILSVLEPSQFMLAVLSSDEKALTRAPGVGKKLAQRLILELKDKLKKEYAAPEAADWAPEIAAGGDKADEARMALQALGYSASEAAAALRKVDPSLPVEELVRGALKALSTL